MDPISITLLLVALTCILTIVVVMGYLTLVNWLVWRKKKR